MVAPPTDRAVSPVSRHRVAFLVVIGTPLVPGHTLSIVSPLQYPQRTPEDPYGLLPECVGLRGGALHLDDLSAVLRILEGLGCHVEIRAGDGLAADVEDLRDATNRELQRVVVTASKRPESETVESALQIFVDYQLGTAPDTPDGGREYKEAVARAVAHPLPCYTIDLAMGTVTAHNKQARSYVGEIADKIDERSRRWWSWILAKSRRFWVVMMLILGLPAVVLSGAGAWYTAKLGFFGAAPPEWWIGNWYVIFCVPGFAVIALMNVLYPRSSRAQVRVVPIVRREAREDARATKREVVAVVVGVVLGIAGTYLAAGR